MMRILGVDPGTRYTGIGVIDVQGNRYSMVHFEVIKIATSKTRPQKLQTIHQEILKIIGCHQPDVMSLEDVFYGKDLKAMIRIGEARACAMLAASEHDLDVVEYPPARVKQSVTGNGRATKEQIQQMIRTLLGLKIVPPPDAADALAVAVCHAHSHKKEYLNIRKAETRLSG